MPSVITRRCENATKILGIFDRREKRQLIVLLCMMIVGAALETLGIGVVASFVAVISKPELVQSNSVLRFLFETSRSSDQGEFIIYFGVTLCVVFVLKNAFLAWLSYRQVKFAYDKEVSLSQQLFVTYLTSPYSFHAQRNSAELLRNLTTEVSYVITGVVMPALMVVTETVVVIFIAGLLAAANPLYAAVALIIFVAMSTTFNHFAKPHLVKLGNQRSTLGSARIQLVNQSLGSVKEVKLLGAEGFLSRAYHRYTVDFARAGLVHHALHAMPRMLIETTVVVTILVAIIIGQHQGRLYALLPVLTLLVLAAARIMPSFVRIAPALNQVRYFFPALNAVAADLHSASGNPELVAVAREAGKIKLQSEIILRDVGFSYEKRDAFSIRGVSLSIPRGCSVAFMGSSGAGKSTLVDLILGLVEPQSGEILIDGVPLEQVKSRWQRSIGYVPQSIYILDDTVRRNVAFGLADDEMDEQRVWYVLRSARLDAFVRGLPQQLDTTLGERGIKISGGERQRIGIARALYRDPDVIVFDEATSALDGATERAISETIGELQGVKTLLIVAHRVSTIQTCDVVYFMKEGRIVDKASFSELMQRNSSFRATLGTADSGDRVFG
jgi:ATP-binding cassette subfamily C protein